MLKRREKKSSENLSWNTLTFVAKILEQYSRKMKLAIQENI